MDDMSFRPVRPCGDVCGGYGCPHGESECHTDRQKRHRWRRESPSELQTCQSIRRQDLLLARGHTEHPSIRRSGPHNLSAFVPVTVAAVVTMLVVGLVSAPAMLLMTVATKGDLLLITRLKTVPHIILVLSTTTSETPELIVESETPGRGGALLPDRSVRRMGALSD